MKNSYAIVQILGKQHIVSEGDALVVDNLEQADAAEVVITDVLLVKTDKEVKVGTPMLAKASVTCTVVSHQKADKIRVAKYRSKSRYRRVFGHRQRLTTLLVKKIAA